MMDGSVQSIQASAYGFCHRLYTRTLNFSSTAHVLIQAPVHATNIFRIPNELAATVISVVESLTLLEAGQ